jgi:hypothetical protein
VTHDLCWFSLPFLCFSVHIPLELLVDIKLFFLFQILGRSYCFRMPGHGALVIGPVSWTVK